MTRLLFALALSLAAPSAWAVDGFAPNLDQIADRIGLDDTQTDSVEQILYDHELALVDLKAEVQRAQLEVKHLLGADAPDRKEVLKAVAALNAAESDVRIAKVELVLSLREIVSAEQWSQLEELKRRAAPAPPAPPTPPR